MDALDGPDAVLGSLDPEQREVALVSRGPVCVLAGAGTTAGPGTSECERTSADPDIVLPAATLGAAYLGGTSLGVLARAGLATEVRGGALAALSAALSWDPAPWCPTIF